MGEGSFQQVYQLPHFRISDSECEYKLKRMENGRCALYMSKDGALEMVGYVTTTPYSFIVSKRVQGLMMTKEIAFNEVIFKVSVLTKK